MEKLEFRESEVNQILANWLVMYTDEVIDYVIGNHKESIINDYTTLYILKKLEEEETLDKRFLANAIRYYDKEKNIKANRLLSKASAYRDVLYDLYIQSKGEK